MRILKIRSWRDAGLWTLDQTLHATIGLASVGWFAQTPLHALGGTAIILTIREIEQGRETVTTWWEDRNSSYRGEEGMEDWVTIPGLLRGLHLLDRTLDIAVGAAIATGAWIAIQSILS